MPAWNPVMERPEFDDYAKDYRSLHADNVRISGEDPDFFASYKVFDTARFITSLGFRKDLRILDFGAGIGNSIPFFKEFLPNAVLTCTDVSTNSLQMAMQSFPGAADFAHFDGSRLPFDDHSFEVVFAACVFHHIPEQDQPCLLEEIYRVLTSGGLFMVFEHNPYNPLTVRAVNSCPFDVNAKLITARSFRKALVKAGFCSINVKYRIFFPHVLRHFRFLEAGLGGVPLGAQYYLAGRK